METLRVVSKNLSGHARSPNSRNRARRKHSRSASNLIRGNRPRSPVAVAPVSITAGSTNRRPTTLDRSSSDKQSGLYRKERAALQYARSLDSDCCFPKSRILQSSGYATLDVRQTTSHILWRELPRTHRSPEGMPRRGDQNLQRPQRTNRD